MALTRDRERRYARRGVVLVQPGQSGPAITPRPRRPALVPPPPVAFDSSTRLLVRMPTRSRPAKAIEMLRLYKAMAGLPVAIEVVVDEDDTSLNGDVLSAMRALGTVTMGRHGSKIAAVNGGQMRDWDVLLLASDDMVPVADGYGRHVLTAMHRHWPHLDGAVFFDDGYQHEKVCTLPIMGRRFYEQFGYVYCPEYQSLWCDVEQTELWRGLGRLAYVDHTIIEHRHHVVTRTGQDALYRRNDALWAADEAVYRRRKAVVRPHAQVGFDSPPLWLSICICSIPGRHLQLKALVNHLWSQILADPETRRCVEVLVDVREGISIGAKRQGLITTARGHFVSFVDDDDGVSGDYVSRVVRVLRGDPGCDCTSLHGVMTTGGKATPFHHSISYAGWSTQGAAHYRTPNHLNAVRRELAVRAGFPAISHGEDFEFSRRLRPMLRREADCGSAPLYFYRYSPVK